MTLLSLTYAEFERLLKIFAVLTILLAGVIFLVRWQCFATPLISALWQGFSTALSVTTIGFGLFSKRKWNSPKLAKWLSRPIVHGVWFGTLHTNYQPANGLALPPIQIVFVIRQTYLALSVESYTKSQEGESRVEALMQNTKTNATRLTYIFELRRYYQGENKLTEGAGELRLLENGSRLKGHYWTNSPTQGEVDLQLASRDCEAIDCFEAGLRIWSEVPGKSGNAAAEGN